MKNERLSWADISTVWNSMKNNIPRAVGLIFSYAPWWTAAGIILIIILGLLPLATLYIMKLLVDTVTAGIIAPDKEIVLQQLTFILLAAALLAFFTTAGRALSSYVTEVQSLIVTDRITDQIHEHSLKLDLAYYENAEYHNTLHRAQGDGPSRPGRVIRNMVQVVQNCISLCAVSTVILSFSPLAGLVLIGAALPAAFLKIWYSHKTFDLSLSQTEMKRKSSYFYNILTFSLYAKELRLFESGSFFREHYSLLRLAIRRAQLALSRSKAMWDTLAQCCITIAVFGSFMVIAGMTIRGETSLGDMVVFFSGFQMCIGYIQSFFNSLNALYEDNLFLTNFFDFLDLKPEISPPDNPVPLPGQIEHGIIVSGLSFTYPGTNKEVLSNISFQLPKGSVTAFVGENGAGKSSLIKLLCRLYLPDKGQILVDGIDLSHVHPDEWRKKISAVFQDYIHYQLSVLENIWIADTHHEPSPTRLDEAAHKSGADKVIQSFPRGYETMLGRFFSQGAELSIGQWQKIALARAFYREAEIVILDEPASSLDALAEAEIFSRFQRIIEGKTAILISHRFSTIMMADNIYVLKEGKIIEEGNHHQLLSKDGLYSEMFHAQVKMYK